MRASWIIAIAAGAAIGVSAPAELMAQGNSNRARQQQPQQARGQQQARPQQQRQQQEAREQARRDAERAQLQRQREQQRQQAARATIRRDDDRYRRDDDRYRRDDRYDRDDRYRRDDRYDDRYRYDRYDRRGPAFCRSGQGHPVHGRQWCRAKGYQLGNERARDIWGDIIFRDRRYDDRRYDDRRLSRGTLGDILGSVVLGRFDDYGRSYYGNGTMTGQWLPDNRASVLQLYVGSMPIARLIDVNRDGRVDDVILTR